MEFKPLNLAQLYQSADASVAQAMQTNLLVLQSSKMKQEFDEEDQLRTLARSSTTTAPDGTPSFDLKGFTKGAYAVNPMKGMAFEASARAAEKATLEKEKLQGDVDAQRRAGAEKRLELMGNAASVPYLKFKELVDSGVAPEEARAQVQPLYVQGIRNLVGSQMFTPEQLDKFDLSPEFDPAKAEAGHRQVLGAKGSLEEYWKGRDARAPKSALGKLKADLDGGKIDKPTYDAAVAKEVFNSEWDYDKDRGILVHKTNGTTKPVTGAGGAPIGAKGADVEGLRKEFNAREEVKNYNAVLPVLRSIENAPNTTAGDLDFIYGVGKILDPGSVVREGEMALVIKSGSPLERIIGKGTWVAGEGKLTPTMRKELMQVLNSRVTQLHGAALEARKPFEAQAKRQNIPLDETLTLPEPPKLKGKDKPGAGGSFASEADAEAAFKAGKLKVGDKITVNGVSGTWQ
jgi:hypothetical protein